MCDAPASACFIRATCAHHHLEIERCGLRVLDQEDTLGYLNLTTGAMRGKQPYSANQRQNHQTTSETICHHWTLVSHPCFVKDDKLMLGSSFDGLGCRS
jgi:hypothetical protein